jgi:hypothetical protein
MNLERNTVFYPKREGEGICESFPWGYDASVESSVADGHTEWRTRLSNGIDDLA